MRCLRFVEGRRSDSPIDFVLAAGSVRVSKILIGCAGCNLIGFGGQERSCTDWWKALNKTVRVSGALLFFYPIDYSDLLL